jgi:hypothetical protein
MVSVGGEALGCSLAAKKNKPAAAALFALYMALVFYLTTVYPLPSLLK